MDFFSSLIGAGANILGGLVGKSTADKARNAAAAQAQQNLQAQYDFAQHGIQWKVEDAKAAGINPLAALGASTSSFSNVVGSSDASDPRASGIAAAGQDLGRAANALSPQDTKQAQLEQKLLEAKIANVNADTISKTAIASQVAVRHGQPGTVSVPLPRPAPGYASTLPRAFQDFRGNHGEIITAPSEEFAKTQFGVGALPSGAQVAVGSAGAFAGNAQDAYSEMAGAAKRSILNGWQPGSNEYYTPF